MESINKAVLIAKIEERRNKNQKICTPEASGAYYEDGFILDIINSLQVKEVDLEKEIDEELDRNWYGEYIRHDKFAESAKHFYELGLKTQRE